MGQSFTQKILARGAGKSSVAVSEIVDVTPDIVLSHDNTSAIASTFNKIGVAKLHDPNRHVIILVIVSCGLKYAQNHKDVREL
jgi:3-isopropylmalate/(R)-2-methylmalate dehydratase large subunit